MTLVKQGVAVNFAQGLDTKTDPKQVQIGKFLSLQNSVFTKGGLLQKRNGYANISSLPNTSYSYTTTFNGDLTAIGPNIAAYNTANSAWVQKGSLTPLGLSTLPIIRNNLNQIACDSSVSPSGLVCTVYLETDGTNTVNKYVVADATTGQNIIAPAPIPVSSGTVSGGMRVFLVNNNFIILFTNVIGGTHHLQYVAINANSGAQITTNTDIANSYVSSNALSFDGFVANDILYIAYDTNSGGQAVVVRYLTSTFTLSAAKTFATYTATIMSVTADITNSSAPVIYASFFDSGSTLSYTLAVDKNLNTLLAPTATGLNAATANLSSAASNGICYLYNEITAAYGFDPALPDNYIGLTEINQAGSIILSSILVLGAGLASKAFAVNNLVYVLVTYQSQYQPTYFLLDATHSVSTAPIVAARLAYQNAGGYLTNGLPSASISGSTAHIPYLYKDLIQAVNKNTNVPAGTPVNGIYSQTGVNLATFVFGTQDLDTTEIGNNLHISGGYLTSYDGYLPTENNFFLYPDMDTINPTDAASWSATGGNMHAQPDGLTNTNAYFYQVTYEWTDNQGNANRSAPSIPIAVTTTGTGTAGSVTLNIPTLRLTYKIANPVKIVIYRWSVGQQIYYQTTSISSPLLNDLSVNYVTYVDTNSDATILGNNILYTTGGVVEEIFHLPLPTS